MSTSTDLRALQQIIEKCLHQYMSRDEIVSVLQVQSNVPPKLTLIVWNKLVEQNSDFFAVYQLRLRLKKQVSDFNSLVEQQLDLQAQQTRALMDNMRFWDENGVEFEEGDDLFANLIVNTSDLDFDTIPDLDGSEFGSFLDENEDVEMDG